MEDKQPAMYLKVERFNNDDEDMRVNIWPGSESVATGTRAIQYALLASTVATLLAMSHETSMSLDDCIEIVRKNAIETKDTGNA